MPSYRYTRDIKPEDLIPEPPPEYTRKEKFKNWWHYSWKWLLAALAVLAMVVVFIVEQARNVKPDITLGILSPYSLPFEVTEALEARLAEAAGDLNGDGKQFALVEVYTIDFSGSEDPNIQMAGVTKLMAAFETAECMLFMADPEQAELYQEGYGLFGTPEGAMVEGGDLTELTVPFSELAVLNAEPIDLSYNIDEGDPILLDGRELLADYRVGMRALYGTKLEDSKDAETWFQVKAIFEALMAGG